MMRDNRAGIVGFILFLVFAGVSFAATPPESLIGIENVIHLALPAGVRPAYETDSPVRLRIGDVQTTPVAGEYDLYYELRAPGTFDLRYFLQSVDGANLAGSAPILVKGISHLPASDPGVLDLAAPTPLPAYGGYRIVCRIASVTWGLVFLALVAWPRKKQSAVTPAAVESSAALDTAGRLETLLQIARTRTITPAETLELELQLLSHWRERLHLSSASAEQAMRQLREDAQAGRLLRNVDRWLHIPPSRSEAIDFDTLRWSDAVDASESRAVIRGSAIS